MPGGTESTWVHVLVEGRVQGVGFRWFTRDAAAALGLSGWVRNLKDGRVELLARGPRPRLDELLARLWEGPPASTVFSLDVSWPGGGDDEAAARADFAIRPTAERAGPAPRSGD